MTIVEKSFSCKEYETSVSEAIVSKCENTNSNGRLENVDDKVDNTARFLGELAELMVTKGLLSEVEIVNLLGYGWKIKE